MNELINDLEGRAEFLETELDGKNTEYKNAVSRYEKDVVHERKRVAAEYLDKIDTYLEDAIDQERESTDTIAELLKANKALYGDIDAVLQKERSLSPKREREHSVERTTKRPIVKKAPGNRRT
jgi:hypothetical protein